MDLDGLKIEYHILQSFPVTCLNRDDVGAPKSAMIGGFLRGRISSQCWKRQVRMALHDLGVRIGVRTKKVSGILLKAMLERGMPEKQGAECAEKIAKALSSNALFFFSGLEADAIAEFAEKHGFEDGKLLSSNGKELAPLLKKEMKGHLNPALDGLDIALFGRMVAQNPDMDMRAAASFSHAITTHRAESEMDFFAALDDMKEEQGSAHIGSLEFNSGTYYRYVCLDLGLLAENIGRENVAEAVRNFTKALYIAIPAARQATMAGMRPWDYARVLVRKGQGMQATFDKPVKSRDGFLEPSITELDRQLDRMEKLSGSMFGRIGGYAFGKDENFSIDDLVAALLDDILNKVLKA